MGYTHGVQWTEEKIENGIKEIIDKLDLQKFPSKTEIKSFYHNEALVNAISRYGGVSYWAKRMGFDEKYCESKMGKFWEMECLVHLQELGYEVDLMKLRYPYDLAVSKHIKVDVKSAYLYKSKTNSPFYTFNLEKSFPSCDIYVCYCLNEDKTVEKTYVIPSVFLCGKCQLSLGVKKSMYDEFIDRWDYFKQYDKFYKELLNN